MSLSYDYTEYDVENVKRNLNPDFAANLNSKIKFNFRKKIFRIFRI